MRGYHNLPTKILAQIGTILFMAAVIAMAYTVLSPGKSMVHADSIRNPDTGGTVTATVTGVVSDTGDLCTAVGDVNGSQHADFGASLSNASINLKGDHSTLKYDLTLKWRGCGENVDAYAVYGSSFCQHVGFYGAGGAPGDAFDCLKYVGSSPVTHDDFMKYLGCDPGSDEVGGKSQWNPNNPCTQPGFPSVSLHQVSPTTAVTKTFPGYTVDINAIDSHTKSNGSRTYSGSLCEYYQYPSGTDYSNDTHPKLVRCRNLSISYKWTYTPPNGNPGGGNPTPQSASCSLSVSPGGNLEINSSRFYATISGSVTLPRNTNTRNAKGAGTVTTYSVINPRIDANSDATPTSQSYPSTSHVFTYDAQSVPKPYGVNGTFSYAVRKTVTVYTLHTVTTTDKKGKKTTTTYLTSSTSSTDSGSSSVPCAAQFQTYVIKPFLQVKGGDVLAGAYPTTSGSCATGAGTIAAWNRGASGGYGGASGQYGVMASGQIINFVSALGLKQPKGLTFANYGNWLANSTYGGGFGSIAANCAFGDPAAEGTPLSNPLSSAPGNGTFYYRGDLTITGNVKYDWKGLLNNPHLKIIVDGNINIAPGVTELDGVYISRGGTINTCYGVSDSDRYYSCSNPLTVYGALVASNIGFNRTLGTVNGTMGGVAEQIIYTPEAWLPTGNGELTGAYDSITSLPPIL